MHEVEAKIPLSKAEFDQLKKTLHQHPEILYKGQFQKTDLYYAHPIPQLTLRLRTVDRKVYFQVKSRHMKQGVEMNREWEWPIKSPSLFKSLLKQGGIEPFFSKVKRTDLFLWKNMQIELNFLKGLGYFLEVEKLVEKASELPQAKIELEALFKTLGYSKSRFEKKPYLELLQSQSF